jgi:hypothetical protein
MEEQHATAEQAKPMPFTEKLTNIFASPGELFENVRTTGPTTSNWLIPWMIFVAVAIAMSLLVVNNPSLADQLGATIREKFDQQVQEGKMTQEQADQTYEQFAKPGSIFFTLMQIGGITVGSLAALFAIGLLYWLVGKSAMGATVQYMKVIEVVGLTFFIGTLEQIVTTFLIFAADSIYATPSLGIFVSDFDIDNKLHVVLSKINAFTFWDLSVVSVGLSKLFQRDFPKVLVLVFALWILWSLLTLFTGFTFGG